MTKRKDNKSTYKVTTQKATYLVTLEHLKNSVSGNPRYTANIITLKVKDEYHNGNYFFTACYNFDGHYYNDEGEAEWIAKHHEEQI